MQNFIESLFNVRPPWRDLAVLPQHRRNCKPKTIKKRKIFGEFQILVDADAALLPLGLTALAHQKDHNRNAAVASDNAEPNFVGERIEKGEHLRVFLFRSLDHDRDSGFLEWLGEVDDSFTRRIDR